MNSQTVILQATAEEMMRFFEQAQHNPNINIKAEYTISIESKTIKEEITAKEVCEILEIKYSTLNKHIADEEHPLNVLIKRNNKNYFSRTEVERIKTEGLL